MPDHLIVIRSPATDYERQGRVRGSLDLPACPEGLADIRAAVATLPGSPPEAIYTAPTACAIEAGRILGSRYDLSPKPLELLANLDLGLWQGKLVSEIRRQQPRTFRQWQDDPWSVIPPEGELLDEARGRVELALEPLGDRGRQPPAGEPITVLPVAAQWRAGVAASPPPPLGGTVAAPRPDVTVS